MRSDRLLRDLALIFAAAFAPRADAQSLAAGAAGITAVTELRLGPDGRVLASMRVGAPVQVLVVKSGWAQLAMEGWLHVSVLGPKRDSFALSVKSPNGALMRVSPDRTAAVSAQLEDGMGLEEVKKAGQWTLVRRVGWVLAKSVKSGAPPVLTPAATAVAAKPGAPPANGKGAPPAAVAITPPAADSVVLTGDVAAARATEILASPAGAPMGTLDSATRLTTGANERGWVRVTLEGWVRERDLIPLDSTSISAISAADLRTDPSRYKGQTVRWVVQVVAFQIADPLRKGLSNDEPYLLARGPGAESALLYLALPPSLIEIAKALAPLSNIIVLARVRSGRSEPSGAPILDVQRIIRR